MIHFSIWWSHLWSFIKLSCTVQELCAVFANWFWTDTFRKLVGTHREDTLRKSTFSVGRISVGRAIELKTIKTAKGLATCTRKPVRDGENKGLYYNTLVTPIVPIFAPYVVVACPHPTAPDKKLQSPSTRIPLFTASGGGTGTLAALAHA